MSFSARSISLAAGAIEQSEVAIDRIRDAGRLGRPRIGGIGVIETALGALGPDRPRCAGRETAQHLGFFQQRLVPEIGFGEFPAQPAEFANPYNGLAADGAAHGFEGVSIRGGEIEQKALAGLAQRIDGMIHLQRRFRRQPGAEGQDALRLILRRIRRHQQRDVAADLRAIVAGRPRDQDLRLGKQQRAETVGLDLQALNVGAQPRFVVGGADAGPHQQDRRHHGETEQRQSRRQHRDFLTIESEEGRNRLLDGGEIAGLGRPDQSPKWRRRPPCAGQEAVPIRPWRASDVHDSKARRIDAITPDMVCPKPHDFAPGARWNAKPVPFLADRAPVRESNDNILNGSRPVRVQTVNAKPRREKMRY